eukprot:CAMPEP_0194479124 /NCGR_PEP_ID=MMETSP0253-20130528/2349_1 /TAXON_ID=2966 /ORGANISM="Noctiluca scintillans" /LENGTH=187 /DNA_ID=CAMNT_0039318301 /DNA_START=13 /DNA_END=576 /DNA_ORIENTATION=+
MKTHHSAHGARQSRGRPPSIVPETTTVTVAAIALLPLPADATTVAFAPTLGTPRFWAIPGEVPVTVTVVTLLITALTSATKAAFPAFPATTKGTLASAFARSAPALTARATGNVRRLELATAVVHDFFEIHLVALQEATADSFVPMNEEIRASIILHDKAKTLIIIEELHGASLRHVEKRNGRKRDS